MHLDEGRLAIGGVDQQAIGKHLDPFTDPFDVAGHLPILALTEPDFENLRGGVLRDQ